MALFFSRDSLIEVCSHWFVNKSIDAFQEGQIMVLEIGTEIASKHET